MKLKYYLRGLGLGILVTAALFLAGDKPKQALTEAEIIEKAKALGMIESPVLSKLNETETLSEIETVIESEEESVAESVVETVAESETETVEESETESVVESEIETVTESETEIETETETETEIETATESEADGEEIVVVVNSGEGSGTVSKRMAELGLVEDANEFDKFLMKNGYDKRISVGNHTMKKGMSWDEMGRELCSRAK